MGKSPRSANSLVSRDGQRAVTPDLLLSIRTHEHILRQIPPLEVQPLPMPAGIGVPLCPLKPHSSVCPACSELSGAPSRLLVTQDRTPVLVSGFEWSCLPVLVAWNVPVVAVIRWHIHFSHQITLSLSCSSRGPDSQHEGQNSAAAQPLWASGVSASLPSPLGSVQGQAQGTGWSRAGFLSVR